MPKSVRGTPRWRRAPEDRRGAILHAALAEFEANGLEGARMDVIAAAAGLSKGSVYRYFPHKTGLFEATIRAAITDSLERYHASGAHEPDAQIRRLWLLAKDSRFIPAYRLALTQPRNSDAGMEAAALVQKGVVKPFAEFLRQTESETPQSAEDLLVTANLVIATILGAGLLELSAPESLSARVVFLLRACSLDSQSPQADGF